MNLVLLLAGGALLALPGLTTSHAERLAPRDRARLSAASIWAGLWAVRAGLALTAAPVVLRFLGVPAMAAACHGMVSPLLPVGTATALIALAALALLQARGTLARRTSRRRRAALHVEPWLGRHEPHGDHTIVVVPTDASLAYAVAGRRPQVVLSEGLLATVDDAELAAIVRHERCHLDHGHQRLLDLASATDAALGFAPGIRRSTATLRLAIERWADEAAAAGTTEGRTVVRHALTRVVRSMLASATPAPAPAFTTVETIAARLHALDQPSPTPSPTRRATSALPPALLALLALAALVATCPM